MLAPGAVEYVPAGHGVHPSLLGAPAWCRYVPATHSTHVALELAPVAPEYVPAAQSRHSAAPGAGLYLPALQSRHASSLIRCGRLEYLPAAQSTHAPPSRMPYLPAGHWRQAGVSGAESGSRSNPGSQMHPSMLVVPAASVCELGMQVVHVAADTCAVRFEYVCTSHSSQTDEFEVVFAPSAVRLYVPSGHAVHQTSFSESTPRP